MSLGDAPKAWSTNGWSLPPPRAGPGNQHIGTDELLVARQAVRLADGAAADRLVPLGPVRTVSPGCKGRPRETRIGPPRSTVSKPCPILLDTISKTSVGRSVGIEWVG